MFKKRPSKKFGVLASTALTLVAVSGAAYAQSSPGSCEGLLERVEALPQELPEDVDWTIEDVRAAAETGNEEECAIILSDVERMAQGQAADQASDTAQDQSEEEMRPVERSRQRVTLQDEAVVEGTVYLDREPASVEVTEEGAEIDVTPGQSSVNVNEQAAQITVREQPARIMVEMAQPTIRIEQPAPEIIITMPEPGVDVSNAEPRIEVRQAEPKVTVNQPSPSVNLELQLAENPEETQGVEVEDRDSGERFAIGETRELPSEDANVTVNRGEPVVRMRSAEDGGQPQISVNRAEPQVTYERAEPQIEFSQAGEPNVQFADSGEPKVTIRRQNEDGSEDAQDASASGASDSQQQADASSDDSQATMQAQADDDATAGNDQSELAQDAEQAAEDVEQTAETAASEAGDEAAEAAQEIESAANEAGNELEAEATEAAQDTEMAAEQAGSEADEAAGENVAATDEPQDDTARMTEDESGDMTGTQGGMADRGDVMTTAEVTGLTADDLTGASLYGMDNEKIGEISQLILAEDTQEIDGAVLEIGGFLGLGAREVMLELDKLEFARSDTGGAIRAYVDMTEEELESLPEWTR